MAEKPVLVIIGEVHAHVVARMLMADGRMVLALKESGGRNMLVADRSQGYERTKRAIRLINEEIPKQETKILRNEKIMRLFREEPETDERKNAYAEYRETHDIKRLRASLRNDDGRMTRQAVEDAKKLVPELKLWPPVQYALEQYFKEDWQENVPPFFSLSTVNAAYKAGVFDIVPAEDARQYREAGEIVELLYLLAHVTERLSVTYMGAKVSNREKNSLLSGLQKESQRLGLILQDKLYALDNEREKAVCRNIAKNYIPGSALLCGLDHVEPMKKLLSRNFEVRVYKVGEKFLDEKGQLKI
jgi:hypothetical protein